MNPLKRLSEDLYACLNIPVQLLNHNMKLIYSIGLSKDISLSLIEQLNLIELQKSSLENNTFTYDDCYHFSFYHVNNSTTKSHYLLLGPFTSNTQNNFISLSYKPKHCIPYLNQFTTAIIAQHQKSKTDYPTYITDSIDYIHAYYEEPIQLDSLSQHLNINKSYLSTLFKQYTDMTFTEFLNRFRTEKSKHYLIHSPDSIMDISLQVGFNNHTYYSTTFKKLYGVTPLEYRKQHTNVS